MKLSMIAAMSNNRVIGKENALPWHLPNDLRFFKESTMGKPIIMGRKTFESIGRPLPGRLNIVITRNSEWNDERVTVVPSLEKAVEIASKEASDKGLEDIMVIGGQQIYTQALPKADRIYLTLVDTEIEGDAFFPEFESTEWSVVSEEAHQACDQNPYNYCFQILERTA